MTLESLQTGARRLLPAFDLEPGTGGLVVRCACGWKIRVGEPLDFQKLLAAAGRGADHSLNLCVLNRRN